MKNIDQIIDQIIADEGSAYTNDPKDSGGPTKYGITQKTLSAHRGKACSPEDVQKLTRDEAAAIYKKRFYFDPKLDLIGALSPEIAAEVMDTGVNMGTGRAVEFLQRLLNGLNREGKDYADIAADGNCGPSTAKALEAYLKVRKKEGEHVLLVALNCLQGTYYVDLASRRVKDESFLYGWLKNRVVEQLK